ncbi:sialate:O-sulfotransferase 1-like [Glandiceps talaboti]
MKSGRLVRKYIVTLSLLTLLITLFYFVHYQSNVSPFSKLYRIIGGKLSLSGVDERATNSNVTKSVRPPVKQCNDAVTWNTRDKPVVGLLGAPGSGLLWLRVIIEQLTGSYSGSVYHDFPKQFKGEGRKEKVLTVMSYYAHKLAEMQYGIILYRKVKDCVQTDYIDKQYYSLNINTSIDDFNADFNVDQWTEFSKMNINEWEEMYRLYLEAKLPYLVIMYDNLWKPEKLKFELIRIARFLDISVPQGILECISQNAQNFKFKPVSLNRKFNPYRLLLNDEQIRLEKFDKYIEKRLRDIYKKPDPIVRWENEIIV